MTLNPHDLAVNAQQLASFPEVAFRIDEVLADERSSAADIGVLIESDPALSAALLRIANSAAYGSMAVADNLQTAVRIVGSREVRDLTYAICATETFKGMPNKLISFEDFWMHSLHCAVASQSVADCAKVGRGKSFFTAGLLHDIGQLVMFNQFPDLSQQALELSLEINDGRGICQAEKEVFGFDHTAVGEELARCWRFPETLRTAITYHHTPNECHEHQDIACVVHVANSVAVLAELESDNFEDAEQIDKKACEEIGIDTDSLLGIIDSTKEGAKELLYLFAN